MREVPTHYLRKNHREWTPSRFLAWDTETADTDDGQVLRLWCAQLVHRGRDAGTPLPVSTAEGTTAEQLADLIARVAPGRAALWCYAHNAAFDLAVTRLPLLLAQRGFHLTAQGIASSAPWFRMARGDDRLTFACSHSLMPMALQDLGALVGMMKGELPDQDDPAERWRDRCRQDVAITARAIGQLMDWWDREQLGNWSVTGPSCGWSTLRHRPAPGRVLIQPDDDVRAFERSALYGGRREVWRYGRFAPGRYLDVDLVHAHLSVCATYPLPARHLSAFQSLPLDDPRLDSPSMDVLAEVEVETPMPRYPWRSSAGIFYPVGRFRTVLPGPEIREARALGHLRAIRAGRTYMVHAHMRPWAEWVTRLMDGPPYDLAPAATAALKGWSRTVPGRWAARTGVEWKRIPRDPGGWSLQRGFLMPGMIPLHTLELGSETIFTLQDQDAEDCLPAVLAWIQSHTRLLLSRLIDAAGDTVLACNTDGALLDDSAATVHREGLQAAVEPLAVRHKGIYQDLLLIGPQHAVLDRERRLSGIPRNAAEVADLTFRYTTWPSMAEQLSQPADAGYRQETRETCLRWVPLNRWKLADGTAIPVRADVTPDGTTRLLPLEPGETEGVPLAPEREQHQVLRAVMREG